MPARYIIAFVTYIPAMDRNVLVAELWDGSKRVTVRYLNPSDTATIQKIKSLYLNNGLGAVEDFYRKKWKLERKTVDTTS